MEEKKTSAPLTDRERALIERNRQKALLLRQSRITAHPYIKPEDCVTRVENSKLIDTGGGFYIEASAISNDNKANGSAAEVIYPTPTSLFQPEASNTCDLCKNSFTQSYLMTTFDLPVCNSCRDDEEKHAVITKTEAKSQYLLKDVDLEAREPKLKFILRKNPHNPRWGDMKLFLHCQVYDRAMEVWGSEEALEDEKVSRGEKREASRRKKFEKSVKELRMAVRSSTYVKELSGHQHEYGQEVYDGEEDNYTKTCTTCGHQLTYEQM